MSATSFRPWPPPPDLESVRELVRTADPEGHIAEGATADEYEPEEEALFALLSPMQTSELTTTQLVPIIERVWRNSFGYDDAALASSRPALRRLAEQIERFFGPNAQPQTRP